MNQYGGIYVPSQDNEKLKNNINWFIDNSKIDKITSGASGIVYSVTLNEDKRQETPFFSLNFNSYKQPVTTLLMKMCVVFDDTNTSSEEYMNLTKDALKKYGVNYVLKNEFIDEINIQTDIYLKTIEYLQPICPAIVYAGIYGDVKNSFDLKLLNKFDIKASLTSSPTIGCIFMEFAEDSMSGNEFYDLLDVKMWRNKYVFLFMYMLIQLSLKTGYTHGDHHLDNFMVNTKDKTYIKGMTARPIIIDFGRSTKIPPPEMDEIKRLCSEHNYNDALQMLCKKPVANLYVADPQYLKSHYGWGCGIQNDNQMMTTYVITELNDNLTNLFQLRERQIDINVSKMNQMHEQEPDKYPLLPLSNAEKNKLFSGLIGGFRKRRNYNKKRNVTRRRRFTKRRARKTHNRRTRNGY
jgi:hypothetical protein